MSSEQPNSNYGGTAQDIRRVAPWRALSSLGASLETLVSGENQYNAFPVGGRLPNGRLVNLYWAGYGHSPSDTLVNPTLPLQPKSQSNVMATVSDDGGSTWSTPRCVYGTKRGLATEATQDIGTNPGSEAFPYFVSFGVDRHGRAIALYIRRNSSTGQELVLQLSDDGEAWSEPQVVEDWKMPNATAPLPFGNGVLTPGGRLLFPGYRSNADASRVINYVMEIDVDTVKVVKIFTADAPDEVGLYSEAALAIVDERHWLLMRRVDRAISSPSIIETKDGGLSWSRITWTNDPEKDSIDLPTSGGYLPQGLFLVLSAGRTWLCALIGLRKSASAPPFGAPGVLLAAAPLEQVLQHQGGWRAVRIWSMESDQALRDSYVWGAYDSESGTLFIATHREVTDYTADILIGGCRLQDALQTSHQSTSSTTIYLMPSGAGNDQNPGTLAQPMRTLKAALAKSPQSGFLRVRLLANTVVEEQIIWPAAAALVIEGWDGASDQPQPGTRQLRLKNVAHSDGLVCGGLLLTGPSAAATVILNNITLYFEAPTDGAARAPANFDAFLACPHWPQFGAISLQLNACVVAHQSNQVPSYMIGAPHSVVNLAMYSGSASLSLSGKWIAGVPAGAFPPARVSTTLATL